MPGGSPFLPPPHHCTLSREKPQYTVLFRLLDEISVMLEQPGVSQNTKEHLGSFPRAQMATLHFERGAFREAIQHLEGIRNAKRDANYVLAEVTHRSLNLMLNELEQNQETWRQETTKLMEVLREHHRQHADYMWADKDLAERLHCGFQELFYYFYNRPKKVILHEKDLLVEEFLKLHQKLFEGSWKECLLSNEGKGFKYPIKLMTVRRGQLHQQVQNNIEAMQRDYPSNGPDGHLSQYTQFYKNAQSVHYELYQINVLARSLEPYARSEDFLIRWPSDEQHPAVLAEEAMEKLHKLVGGVIDNQRGTAIVCLVLCLEKLKGKVQNYAGHCDKVLHKLKSAFPDRRLLEVLEPYMESLKTFDPVHAVKSPLPLNPQPMANKQHTMFPVPLYLAQSQPRAVTTSQDVTNRNPHFGPHQLKECQQRCRQIPFEQCLPKFQPQCIQLSQISTQFQNIADNLSIFPSRAPPLLQHKQQQNVPQSQSPQVVTRSNMTTSKRKLPPGLQPEDQNGKKRRCTKHDGAMVIVHDSTRQTRCASSCGSGSGSGHDVAISASVFWDDSQIFDDCRAQPLLLTDLPQIWAQPQAVFPDFFLPLNGMQCVI